MGHRKHIVKGKMKAKGKQIQQQLKERGLAMDILIIYLHFNLVGIQCKCTTLIQSNHHKIHYINSTVQQSPPRNNDTIDDDYHFFF